MPSENSSIEFRCDTGTIPTFELSPEGYLKAWAKIARTGVQLYQTENGIRREYRPPEEVSKADSLKSFSEVPICFEHPPAMLSAINAKQASIGWTGEKVIYDGGFVATSAKIIDAQAIEAILSGKKTELSAGYSCRIEMTPGVAPNGEAYDCIQREIQGNHVAITAKARGGAELKLMDRKDSKWAEAIISFPSERLDSIYIEVNRNDENNKAERSGMYKLEEMSKDELIELVRKMEKDMESKEDSLKKYMDSASYYEGIVTAFKQVGSEPESNTNSTDADKFASQLIAKQALVKDLEKRVDSASDEIDTLKREITKLEEKNRRLDSDLSAELQGKDAEIKKAKQTWLETYHACEDYLPHMDSSIVDLTPVDMMRLSIEHSCPSIEITSDDPIYIKGMFDLMRKGDIRNDTSNFNRNLAEAKQADIVGSSSSLQDLRQKRIQEQQKAWQVRN
jgi:hypothetical protein